jgi:hypothetical protein
MKMIKTMLIGAVEYTISRDEQNVVTARYISSGSMSMKPGTICRGRAVGDTSNGFPGDYVIHYYDVDDNLAAEYNWHLESVGDCFRLEWRSRSGDDPLACEADELLYEGFGFPNSDRSIVVAYWFSEGLNRRLAPREFAEK